MKKLALIVLFATAGTASAQPRLHLSFDRDWRFHLGDTTSATPAAATAANGTVATPAAATAANGTVAPPAAAASANGTAAIPAAATFAFDDRGWRELDLPHDWSIEGAFDKNAPTGGGGGYLPTGIGWYRKTFTLPRKGGLVSIQFDGVYMNSDVWINGHHLGHRPNGYISFAYDLTPYLKKGPNTLAVRVDNSLQPNSRWYSGSGIYRHVWLDIRPKEHIAQWGTYVTTHGNDVTIQTTIDNPVPGDSLIAQIIDAGGKIVATASTLATAAEPAAPSGAVPQHLFLDAPYRWSPDHPYLYTVHSLIRSHGKITDEYATRFAFRDISYSDTSGFTLDGKRIKMNGVCLHGDGGCVGAAVPEIIWRERLRLLKAMGCNAIRTSHNPPAPEFLDLCDEMGFLVMDEAFDAWESGKVKNDYHLYFDEWSQRDVTDQIHRDRNHPSIVLWSAGNEIPDQTSDKGVELLDALLKTFHAKDPTRPVTTANDDIAADGHATKVAFLDAEDIVGYNYVDRWHERRERYYGPDHYAHPHWKMIGTESGSVRSPDAYSLGNDPQRPSPNYVSGMINAEQLWKFVAVHDYVIGDFMWTGVDYLGEARWPGKGSSSGVIDMTNLPKDGYYFYQSQWTDTPVLHLLPHWNWPGREGQVIPVIAYTNCDTVELYLNDKYLGTKYREFPRQGNSGAWNKYDRPYVAITTADLHLTWDVGYAPGVIKAVGHKNGQIITKEIRTTGAPAALKITADTADNVATIHIDIVDAGGNVVPTADNLLTFSITGPGRLIGVDNGNQRDDDAFTLPQRHAFKGHAYAVIRRDGHSGAVRLTVSAAGLPSVTTTLPSARVATDAR